MTTENTNGAALDALIMLDRISCSYEDSLRVDAVADTVRLLQARVQELEAQRMALTPNEVSGLLESAGYWQGDSQRADFINGLRHGEMAHGITQQAPAPANLTFMTDAQAHAHAWSKVREAVGTEGWTVGDRANYHGFFMWGWHYRAEYEKQRTAVTKEEGK